MWCQIKKNSSCFSTKTEAFLTRDPKNSSSKAATKLMSQWRGGANLEQISVPQFRTILIINMYIIYLLNFLKCPMHSIYRYDRSSLTSSYIFLQDEYSVASFKYSSLSQMNTTEPLSLLWLWEGYYSNHRGFFFPSELYCFIYAW